MSLREAPFRHHPTPTARSCTRGAQLDYFGWERDEFPAHLCEGVREESSLDQVTEIGVAAERWSVTFLWSGIQPSALQRVDTPGTESHLQSDPRSERTPRTVHRCEVCGPSPSPDPRGRPAR
eukprot:Sspe_Gene.30350::Locus_15013_Transcript_6_7_Confidence_0.308_Length_439::g.30350::m.30350